MQLIHIQFSARTMYVNKIDLDVDQKNNNLHRSLYLHMIERREWKTPTLLFYFAIVNRARDYLV